MYHETRPDYDGDWPAMVKIAELVGVSTPETLLRWVRQAELDRPGQQSSILCVNPLIGVNRMDWGGLSSRSARCEVSMACRSPHRPTTSGATSSLPHASNGTRRCWSRAVVSTRPTSASMVPARSGCNSTGRALPWRAARSNCSCARRIVGWRAGTTMGTQLVRDALEQAIWTRQLEGHDLTGLLHHSDRGCQVKSTGCRNTS